MNCTDVAIVGNEISEKLYNLHLIGGNTLQIELSENDFKKMDEDLYYRQNPNGTNYIPSDDEIILAFKNLKIKFVKK